LLLKLSKIASGQDPMRHLLKAPAILLLAIWIASPLMSVAHAAMVAHTYCAEHERVEEGDNIHATKHHDESHALSAVSPVQEDNAHKDCAFSEDFTLEEYFVLASSLIVEVAPTIEVAPVLHSKTDAKGLPLLLIAPKSSPPLFA
jgi:hypothetical protein